MKRATHIPQEIAGLVDILIERLVADALAEQRQEQRHEQGAGMRGRCRRPTPARSPCVTANMRW